MSNPRKFYLTYLARGDKLRDRFEDALVIRTIARHHIYKDILHPSLERHSRAEKNSTMTLDSFAVAINENYATIIGHVPRTISVPFDLF